MILLAFRHGLRAFELCSLRWEQVDLVHGRLGGDFSADVLVRPCGSKRLIESVRTLAGIKR
jgi:hypothetical protein